MRIYIVALLTTAMLLAMAAAPALVEVKLINGISFGSTIFADFSVKSDNIGTSYKASNGFHISRAYLYMTDKVTDSITARITLDTNPSPASGGATVFVKHAYIENRISDLLVARGGITDTEWISFEDKLYTFRYTGSVFADRVGAETSADAGFSLSGGSEGFSYIMGLYNGEGYKNPGMGDGYAISGRIGYELPFGLGAAVAYRSESSRNGTLGYDPTRFIGMLYYKQSDFTIAAQYLSANDFSGVTKPAGAVFADGNGYSVWAWTNLGESFRLLGRYDAMTNVTRTGIAGTTPNSQSTYYITGFAYTMAKGQEVGLFYSGTVNGIQTNTISANLLTGF